jgi:bifunctional non-homologous end joining protein LigD
LQNAFEAAQPAPIVYMLFDILYYRGNDLREAPLRERRDLLRVLLQDGGDSILHFSEHIEAKASELLDTACNMRVEGLIGKRADSSYQSGRTRDWIKLKCLQRQEFVIGGYTDASNKNVRAIGALLLGVHDEQGNLRYAGKVGTGFTQRSAVELHEKLQPLQTAKSSFADRIRQSQVRQSQVHWVKPALLAEIEFSAWTDDGHIRHSSFQGLRTDKPAAAITREMAAHIDDNVISPEREPQVSSKRKVSAMKTTAKTAPAQRARATRSTAARNHAEVAGIAISHPDRVIDDSSGTTKLELAHYYENVAPQLLAHLKDRPVSLVRAPAGVGGEVFFQKHHGNLRIPELTELDPSLLPGHPPLIAIDSLAALIHCVQMNVVEFHTWNARLAHSEQPDRMVFDLDPGAGIVWRQLVEAAQLMKGMLDELRLKCFLKTSGGKGLHIIVPLAPRDGWQQVRDFSEMLVRHMAQTLPQLFVATSGPKNRVGRIFIDYLRNNRGSTTAAAFSARLRPGLGVSAPLAWDELNDIESSSQWHVGNIDADVAATRARCWRNYARVKQTLTRAYKILQKVQ